MTDERSKISLKLLAQKNETSNRNTESRLFCKSGSSQNKTKMETPTSRIISARSVPSNPIRKIDGKDFERQSKSKFLNVIPRNPSKETSEGVQEFIKHVSQYIEKKTPFKGATRCSYPDGGSTESPRFNSIQFNGVARKLIGKKNAEGSKLEKNSTENGNNKKSVMNHPVKLNSVSPLKKDSIVVRETKISTKRTEEVNKKVRKNLPENNEIQSHTVEEKLTSSPLKKPVRGRTVVDGPVQNKIKRRRPSEIPLRKDRTDSYKKPKFVSLLKKPLKQVESAASISFSSNSKSFLPMEEYNNCQELQMTINVDFSLENMNIKGQKIEPEDQEMQESIKLDRCFKSPNIPDVVESSTSNTLEEKPSTGKKLNAIDLNKVKTSSFTVLRSSSTVLDRLESLHKQNVLSKEKSASGKTPSKLKVLTSKASLISLKEKNSKKSSFTGLSGKGNKCLLKLKNKRSRKDTNQEPAISRKKRPRAKSGTPSVKETTTTEKVVRTSNVERSSRSKKVENVTNGSLKANVENRKKEESTMHRIKSSKEKSALRAICRVEEFKPSDPVISGVEYFECQNLEQSNSDTANSNSDTPASKISNKQSLHIISNDEKREMRRNSEKNIPNPETPSTPPPTPVSLMRNDDFAQVEQVMSEEWSSKTVIFDEKFNTDNYGWCNIEQETETPDIDTIAEQAGESEKIVKRPDLFIKGTLLNFCNGKLIEKPKTLESSPVKKQLRIDLNPHEASTDDERVEDNGENKSTVDSIVDFGEGSTCKNDLSNDAEKEGITEGLNVDIDIEIEGCVKSKNVFGDILSSEVTDEPGSFSQTIQTPLMSCSLLKRKQQCKSGGMRKKKIRSDAGDRPSPSHSALFNSDSPLQNKTKPDAKMRSGLTKSSKWEEKSDTFEDATAIKLKRRNSEPNSFRGYVWKCADATTPRGHKTSVSSMTSSLRHLNTDDIDDFIFWEAVPQKMSSCWEMSLYHFKRPWSVLSCSVFRDNRMSSTPGLILENLRNGGTLNTRRSTMNQNERVASRKENPFDVEPSIAQKNIDIRNWLAALNFPTLPSTSTDVFSEGNFTTQFSVDSQTLNKVSPKKRKALPNLKLSEEVHKKKTEEKEKYRRTSKWQSCEEEGLTELIRRKSGGFVTKEQFLNSEHSVHRPNVTVNFCVYSKSAEESILVETNDRNSVCEPRKYKSVEVATQPEVSISATIINSGAVVGDQLVEKIKTKEKPQDIRKEEREIENGCGKFLKADVRPLRSDVNIWKYLFLMTLFLIVVHYCVLNSFLGHN